MVGLTNVQHTIIFFCQSVHASLCHTFPHGLRTYVKVVKRTDKIKTKCQEMGYND